MVSEFGLGVNDPKLQTDLFSRHRAEWQQSAVSDALIDLNVLSLSGRTALDYLFYSDKLPRRNDGRVAESIYKRYRILENHGGWWVSGVDVLTGEDSEWGQYKSDKPRVDRDRGKPIKYEAPPKVPTEIVALKVPFALWQKISRRFGVPFLSRGAGGREQGGNLSDAVKGDAGRGELRDGNCPASQDSPIPVSSGLPRVSEEQIPHSGREENSCTKTSPCPRVPASPRPSTTGDCVTGDCTLISPRVPASPRPYNASNFWQWVYNHPELPLFITEGAKKAGCLITATYIAIALPGVYNGCRQEKNEFGKGYGPYTLIPQLAYFAQPGRKIYFAFDQDTKRKTRHNVNKAIARTASLFADAGCIPKIITWTANAKGVDDLIAQHGAPAFDIAYQRAIDFKIWNALRYAQLTYEGDVVINQRYLGDIKPPADAQIICLRAPKGTGKTHWLAKQVEELIASGERRILVLTHRVQLGGELCQRLGIDYIDELRDSETGGVFGYGLCMDSAHPNSKARFNSSDWEGCVIIMDEAEQSIWHLLNSPTCLNERVSIIRTIKEVMNNCINHGGKIYLSDADLSDISINYVQSIIGHQVKRWILINEYQPSTPWQIYHYQDKNPKVLVDSLVEHIKQGGKPFVCLSAQKAKSKWSTINLEKFFKNLFPHIRILRIDSESISNPNHPAYGCMKRLNDIFIYYDMVLASPVIETGVSIECERPISSAAQTPLAFECLKLGIPFTIDPDLKVPHFSSVWGIFSGVQDTNTVRQSLSRVRQPIPRHIWMRKFSSHKIGNGSCTPSGLLKSTQKLTKANILRLQQADLNDDFDFDLKFQQESLLGWSTRGAVINGGMCQYREQIIHGLIEEGHKIINPNLADTNNADETERLVTESRDEGYAEYRTQIAEAPNPDDTQYERLKEQRAKTAPERHRYHHGRLKRKYGGVEVTPELVELDDKHWDKKIRLHYSFTEGREFVDELDAHTARMQHERGQGAIFSPDFVKSQMGLKVWVLDKMGLAQLLEPRERRADDPAVYAVAQFCVEHARDVRDSLGVNVYRPNGGVHTPMKITQMVLDRLGLVCPFVRKEGPRGKQVRVYGPPVSMFSKDVDDGRNAVFATWFDRDGKVIEKHRAQAENKSVVAQDISNRSTAYATTTTESESTPLEDLLLALMVGVNCVRNTFHKFSEEVKQAVLAQLTAAQLQQLDEML